MKNKNLFRKILTVIAVIIVLIILWIANLKVFNLVGISNLFVIIAVDVIFDLIIAVLLFIMYKKNN